MSTPEYLVVALLIAVAVVLVVRFEVFCIRDIYATPEHRLRYLTRIGWAAVCLVTIPIGGVLYLYLGKE